MITHQALCRGELSPRVHDAVAHGFLISALVMFICSDVAGSPEVAPNNLAAHPDAEFTPHAIGRVLARSSGAVANALDRLTALGHAQLTSDRPRRYRHQAATAPTPATAGTTT